MRRSLILVVSHMKAYFAIFLFLLSTPSYAQELKSFVGLFSSSRLSRYSPEVECDAKDKSLCGESMVGYYVYTLKPVSTAKTPRKITITMLSHTLRIRKSKSLWLIQVKDLDPVVAKRTGAKYELVDYALIDGDTCSEVSFLETSWLYPTDVKLEEYYDFRGDNCYKSVRN